MSKWKKIIIIVLSVLVISVFVIGIPIVINECYKANCGYSTAWDASAMLGYYGTVLGAIITVATLVATITFTKKQIQRESFLKAESEKWDKLKSVFLEILENINPMVTLKDVMDAHLNMNDYPKVKHLVDGITEMAEEFVEISKGEVDQYSDFNILKNKDVFMLMAERENAYPGSFAKEDMEENQANIEKLKTLNNEAINSQIKHLNSEFIRVYETKYRASLQSIGSTFETLEMESMRDADRLLNIGVKSKIKTKKKQKKSNSE